jgi:hypothetical protein
MGGTPQFLRAEIRTVYVIPSSHWDRGFLTSPEEILPRLKPHLDEVIDDAAADPEFRWTIESIWQLHEWLKRTDDPKRIAQLRDLVQRGQIEISLAYGSMHTEFMGPEELNLITQDGFRMARTLGIEPPELVWMNDVPGFTERLPQVLAGSRVRYFLNGSNLFIGGGTDLAPGQVPFYWQGPDGSRVLTWVSQGKSGGYVEGMHDYYLAPSTPDPYYGKPFYPKELEGKPPLEIMEIGMKRLLETYQKAGYKYDAVLVMYVHDFVAPTAEKDHLLPSVRQWNASGRSPQIRVAIPREFFSHILSKYGSQLPTYRGDWSGLWTEVKTNSPGISALAREVQRALRTSSLLWGALELKSGVAMPAGNLLLDYRRLWNYDEHSGAGQVGWPQLMSVQEVNDQNRQYVEYVRDALLDQRALLNTGLRRALEAASARPPESKAQTTAALAVFQPLSWNAVSLIGVPRTGELQNAGSLRDASSGAVFPVQWTETEGLIAAPLPPTGIATFEPAPGAVPAVESAAREGERVLENAFYRLELRPEDGAVARLLDRAANREIVNSAARDALNQLVRTVGFSERAEPAKSTVTLEFNRGLVFDSLRVWRQASYEPITEYRLYHGLKRLEIRNLLDRSRLPTVTLSDKPNLYHYAFPLLPGAPIQTLEYENGNGLTTFPQDHLPGGRRDAVVTHGILVAAGNFRVALASPQVFYWNLPTARQDSWTLLDNQIMAAALRKQDAGDTRDVGNFIFPTVEPGLLDQIWFVFSLTSWEGPDDPGERWRKIWEMVTPPVAAVTAAATNKANAGSFFTTDHHDVVVMAVAPSITQNGGVVLRLQEVAGTARRVRVRLPATNLEARLVDLTEAPLGSGHLVSQGDALELDVGAHATVSILLTRKQP